MKLIKKGKVKDIYELDRDRLVFHFSNRVSAFDIIMHDEIPNKGKVLCDFAVFWFSILKVKNHFIERLDSDKIIVKKINIIPIECVVRNYLYGSLYARYREGILNSNEFEPLYAKDTLKLASKLPLTLFDPTTKSEDHDIPITEDDIIKNNVLSRTNFHFLKNISIDLFRQMDVLLDSCKFILADVKYEFGFEPSTGEILLADSLGPDEFRIWNKDEYSVGKLQESYDKQILRDWLDKIGFKETIDNYAKIGKKPDPPRLPDELVKKISDRYISAYERITNTKFNKNT